MRPVIAPHTACWLCKPHKAPIHAWSSAMLYTHTKIALRTHPTQSAVALPHGDAGQRTLFIPYLNSRTRNTYCASSTLGSRRSPNTCSRGTALLGRGPSCPWECAGHRRHGAAKAALLSLKVSQPLSACWSESRGRQRPPGSALGVYWEFVG